MVSSKPEQSKTAWLGLSNTSINAINPKETLSSSNWTLERPLIWWNPINLSLDKAQDLASCFGCNLGSFPFTYLGLPLGIAKPYFQDFAPLLDRIETCLSACSYFLSFGGKITMINSVFSLLPTYYMCTLKLSMGVIEAIDRARRHCLWRGPDFSVKKKLFGSLGHGV